MVSHSPLVIGRDREVAELTRAIDAARASRGGAVFLVGEAGIGKSRLASEAAGIAFAAGVRVLRGRGSTIGPIVPFRPLTEALLALFRGGHLPDDVALGPYRPILGRLIPDLQQPGGVDVGDSLIVLGEAVLRLVTLAGRSHGCMLILEDLQHADAETLAIVEYLTDNLADLPVLLVATIRDEPCAARDLARLATQRHAASMMTLSRLTAADVSRLAAACLEAKPEDLPDEVVDRLTEDSAGVPFIIEEVLHQLVSDGVLVKGAAGWRVIGTLRPDVPETVLRGVIDRVGQLGPQGSMLLSVAAVLGDRFPLSVVGQVTALDQRSMLSHLRAAVAAQIVAPDDESPDWYAFRHPLMAEALRSSLPPADRAEYSRQASAAVKALHPDLPGEWCQLVATLQADSGDIQGAATLFAEAGRRALADGASESSVKLLDRANTLLQGESTAESKARILETLLYALAEAGQVDRARMLVDTLDEQLNGASLSPGTRAALHTRLANVYYLAGLFAEGMEQVIAAREVLGSDAPEEHTAAIDVIAASLTRHGRGDNRAAEAEALARRAIASAERGNSPHVLCEAWLILGELARDRSMAESVDCFQRGLKIAEGHRLPIWRVYALVLLAVNSWLSDGDPSGYQRTLDEAQRVGAVTLGYTVQGNIAMDAALRGDFAKTSHLIAQYKQDVIRLRLRPQLRYLLMVQTILAAHQGKRSEMDQAIAEFSEWQDEHSHEFPLVLGLARAFCALLEENRGLARDELAKMLAATEGLPSNYHLAGRHGLCLFLAVLEQEAGWSEYQAVLSDAQAAMRWNRQFVRLAEAVLLGREGRIEEANAAAAAAQQDSEIYGMVRHIVLRLAAEAAIADGWGEPIAWLRRAEEYFHQLSVPAVAGACRSLLRHAGASVKQRRTGIDQVPDDLRAIGVTVREHEVLQLLVERLTNKAIANRLHISPRTVEKHVASLIMKADVADRVELSDFAASAYGEAQ
ncbi:helix-turn-helix transcriptional regulator [Kibdelosporangium persicum]|uniref:Helix-turn-helix transcriptional regulator n=1 Tax=Kibdelosporangium persicum TaxID=2698649 RepID=A0ABX2F3Y9_9PSEU|nr:LuxR family transcriptional regulator [Kibdelosporangium persicum]NRN65864.1 Helix-turn-helix transcriptional regulator [Kibdelosporangium persicum]